MILIVDSWAWLSLTEETDIAELSFQYIKDKKNKIYTTHLNIYEIFYRVKEKSNDEEAREFVESVKKSADIIEIDEEISLLAGDLHLTDKLSVVDAFVYATAIKHGAQVLTGDPHFKNKKNVIYLG